MDDLIAALQILRKYGNPKYPTYCVHDELAIADIFPVQGSGEDIVELERLGLIIGEADGEESFMSCKFGSC